MKIDVHKTSNDFIRNKTCNFRFFLFFITFYMIKKTLSRLKYRQEILILKIKWMRDFFYILEPILGFVLKKYLKKKNKHSNKIISNHIFVRDKFKKK